MSTHGTSEAPQAHRHDGVRGTTSAIARLRIALGAVVVVLLVEIAVGTRAHSLALISDAGHLATDTGTLGLAWFATARSRRPSSARHTFGHHRTGILVAAINATVLLAVAVAVAVAAVLRLRHPMPVDAAPVLAVAVFALVVNISLARTLNGGGGELSTRSAMLHVIGDALASAGVIVSALIILTTGWQSADAAVSLVIAALIAATAAGLLREAARILAESTPSDIDADAVRTLIAGTHGITDVHDLHIWSLSRTHRALSAHVTIGDRPLGEVTAILHQLEMMLCTDFNIEHATLQPECPSCQDGAPLYCDLSERHDLVHATGPVATPRRPEP
jgi:cobalt-zinc-cadmium efflux system protein